MKDTLNSISFDVQNDKTQEKVGDLKSEKPIEVLFEGIDTNIYKKTNEFSKSFVEEMDRVDETFNFLYVGHW